mgnify:CR=1 FL=1
MSALGTEFKINVHVEPIDGMHMSGYDFECEFYCYRNKTIKVSKRDMVMVDEDNYVALVDSAKIGAGKVNLLFTAYIPDDDFSDMLRTEVAYVETGITIQKY